MHRERELMKGGERAAGQGQPSQSQAAVPSPPSLPLQPPFPSSECLSPVCAAVHHQLGPGERLQQLAAAARRHAQLRQEAPADGGQGSGSPPAAHQGRELHQAGGGPRQRPGPAGLQHALHRHRYDRCAFKKQLRSPPCRLRCPARVCWYLLSAQS